MAGLAVLSFPQISVSEGHRSKDPFKQLATFGWSHCQPLSRGRTARGAQRAIHRSDNELKTATAASAVILRLVIRLTTEVGNTEFRIWDYHEKPDSILY